MPIMCFIAHEILWSRESASRFLISAHKSVAFGIEHLTPIKPLIKTFTQMLKFWNCLIKQFQIFVYHGYQLPLLSSVCKRKIYHIVAPGIRTVIIGFVSFIKFLTVSNIAFSLMICNYIADVILNKSKPTQFNNTPCHYDLQNNGLYRLAANINITLLEP